MLILPDSLPGQESMDFSVPAVTAYERLLASVDKAMALLFAINEFIDKETISTSELMEQCLAARDSMSQYAALVTNAMQFSLCFGFVETFIQLNAGVFDAVPWVGVTSLAMAFVTPVMVAIERLPLHSHNLSSSTGCWKSKSRRSSARNFLMFSLSDASLL